MGCNYLSLSLIPTSGTQVLIMMTSSTGNIFRVTGPLCGEFNGHRWIPHTKAIDGALMFSLICAWKKRLSKQSWSWWIETPSRSLWRHCNVRFLLQDGKCENTTAKWLHFTTCRSNFQTGLSKNATKRDEYIWYCRWEKIYYSRNPL